MTVTSTYTDPSPGGALDLAAGATVTETNWDALVSNFLYLAGATGVITQVAFAKGSTSSPTTTSTSLVAMTDPVFSMTTQAGSTVLVLFTGTFSGSTLASTQSYAVFMDAGIGSNVAMVNDVKVANARDVIAVVAYYSSVTAAAHTFAPYWTTSAGTLTAFGTARQMIAVELRR